MEQRGPVGKDADDIGAARDLSVEPFQVTGRPDSAPVRLGKSAKTVICSVASRSIDTGVIKAAPPLPVRPTTMPMPKETIEQ